MTLPQDILDKIKKCLKEIAPDARSILYGSQARGDSRPDSDIDLLILLPESYTGRDFVLKRADISDALYDLSLDNGIDISPLIVSAKEYYSRKTPFTINIANEGIEL